MKAVILRVRLLALAVAWTIGAYAQEQPSDFPAVTLPHTEIRVLHSREVQAEYKLYLGLPASYQDSSQAYPVVYMLDADYAFALAKNIVDHLCERHHLREVILVAIAYAGPPN